MKKSAFSIIIAFVLFSITGLALIPELSVSLFPNKNLPEINVFYSWPGASSLQVEQKITSKLESALGGIRGIKKISSKSSNNSGYVNIEIDKNEDIDFCRFEIANTIRNIYNDFPLNASYPVIRVNSPDKDDKQFFRAYIVNADISKSELSEYVRDKLISKLNGIDGIQEIALSGATEKEYVLRYSEDKLKLLGLTKEILIEKLKQNFNQKQIGISDRGMQRINVSLLSEKTGNWHFAISNINGRIVYFDELVNIKLEDKTEHSYHRINGKNAVSFFIYPEKGANSLKLAKILDEEINILQNSIESEYSIVKVYDSSEHVKKELNTIYLRSILTLLILLLFTIIAYFNFKYISVIFISLLCNLLIAINIYYFLDIQIQLYSLAGITISLGLMIDNIVVVVDQKIKNSKGKIINSLISSTLTTIGALLSIYFLNDNIKLNLIDFALIIIINLSLSIVIAVFLVPALMQKLNISRNNDVKKVGLDKFYPYYKKYIEIILQNKKLAFVFVILFFGIPTFMLPNKINSDIFLARAYNYTLGSSFYTENIRKYVDKTLGGTFRLFSNYVFESSYYDNEREVALYINAYKEKGSTVEQMNEVILQIENTLAEFSDIKMFESNVYSGTRGRIEVKFNKEDQNSFLPYLIKSKVIMKALDLGGVSWSIYGVGDGFNNSSSSGLPVNYVLEAKGYNYNDLNSQCEIIKSKLLAHPRIHEVYIKENTPQRIIPKEGYILSLDKAKLSQMQLSLFSVINNLNKYTYNPWSDLYVQGKHRNIGLRFESEESVNFDLWNLKNQNIGSLEKPYKLGLISTIDDYSEEENIYKENQEYIRRIEWQYAGAEKFGDKHLKKVLDEYLPEAPMGYTFKQKENDWYYSMQNENNVNYLFILLLIAGIIYFISTITFENFFQPFVIIALIPLSFTGVFLTFYIFDLNFDQGGMSAFVLLSGITVNSSIYLINSFNYYIKDYSPINAYIEAFKSKITPILLTIISTILGFIPFIYKGQTEVFWFALGAATIGGLIMSLLVIILILPVMLLKAKR